MDFRDAAAFHALVLSAEGASLSTQRNYLFYWSKLIEFCEQTGLGPQVEQFSPDLVRRASVWYRDQAQGRRNGAVGGRQFVQRMNTIGAMLIREKIIRKSAYQSLKLPRVATSHLRANLPMMKTGDGGAVSTLRATSPAVDHAPRRSRPGSQ